MANTPKSRRTQSSPAPRTSGGYSSTASKRAKWVKWVGIALILAMILPVVFLAAGSGLGF